MMEVVTTCEWSTWDTDCDSEVHDCAPVVPKSLKEMEEEKVECSWAT